MQNWGVATGGDKRSDSRNEQMGVVELGKDHYVCPKGHRHLLFDTRAMLWGVKLI